MFSICSNGCIKSWRNTKKLAKEKKLLMEKTVLLTQIEKGIKGKMCHSVHRHAKANNKYMDYYKSKKSSYLKYWVVNSLSSWTISKKLPADGLKWVRNTSQFNKDFDNNNKDF